MANLARVIKDSVYYLISQITAPLIAFAVIPVYTRFFNSSEYGHFVIISTTINFLIMLGPSAVDSAIIRFYKRNQSNNKDSDFIATAFYLLVLCIFVSALIAYIVIINLNSIFRINEVYLIIMMLAVFMIDSLFRSFLNLARTLEFAGLYSSLNIIHLLIRTSLGLFFFLVLYSGIPGILAGWLTGGLIAVIVIAFRMKAYIKINPCSFSKSVTKTIFAYGMPFPFIVVSGLAMDQIDRYMIMYFRGSAEVGIYNAGYLIASNSIYIFSSFLIMAAFPVIISTWEKEGKFASQDLMSKLLRLFFILCLPACVGVSLLAKEVLGIILPAEYLPGYTIVPWVAFGAFFAGLLQYYTKSMNLLEKSLSYAGLHITGLFFNFLLNLILIPALGFLGAGLSTAISYFVIFIIMIFLNNKVFNLRWVLPIRSLINISISTLIMGILIYYIKLIFSGFVSIWNLILIIITGVLIYFISLIIFKEISKNEILSFIQLIFRTDKARKKRF